MFIFAYALYYSICFISEDIVNTYLLILIHYISISVRIAVHNSRVKLVMGVVKRASPRLNCHPPQSQRDFVDETLLK